MIRRVLASASPRRREILATLGIAFDVVASDVDEDALGVGLPPVELATRLALAKARDVAAREAGFVLGADTVVVAGDAVLGKPRDDADATRMIARLAGAAHEVITGVAVVGGGFCEAVAVSTRVWFRALDAATVARYVATGEGRDKAGAYAVQGVGAGLVTRIEGSYTNVVGLPAAETIALLERAGALEGWP